MSVANMTTLNSQSNSENRAVSRAPYHRGKQLLGLNAIGYTHISVPAAARAALMTRP